MAYTFDQLKDIWIRNGGNPTIANVAAAVALAESGGNPLATGHNTDGSVDRGLWQINSIHGAKSTYDIDANARSAVSISSNGTNWNPWTVFKSGAYRKYLNGNPDLSNQMPSGAPPTGGINLNPFDAIVGPVKTIAEGFTNFIKAGQWVSDPHNVIRIVQVLSGVGLILIGIVILSRGLIEETVGKVAKVATKVAL